MSDDPDTSKEFTKATWVWLRIVQGDARVSSGAFVLAFLLCAYYFNRKERGFAWPSVATLALKMHKSERAAGAHVKELEALGHLLVERRGPHASRYRMASKDTQKTAEQAEPSRPLKNRRKLPNKEPKKPADLQNDDRQFSVKCSANSGEMIGNFASPYIEELSEEPSEELSEVNTPPKPHSHSRRAGRRSNLKAGGEEIERDFAEWYDLYPLKKDRAEARKAYAKVITTGAATHQQLIDGVRRYVVDQQANAWRNPKHPTTWLNKGSWADEPTIINTTTPQRRTGLGPVLDALRDDLES